MPTTALCTAMCRDQRAMSIASASRSTRSVVNTMSAASEEAVAPRAPIATPTVAAASAGASLIPSPTITVTARSRSARTAATLSAGALLGVHLVQSQHRGDLAGRLGAVAGEHHQSFSPAARSRRTVRGAWRRSGSRSNTAPAGSPVDADPRDRCAVQPGPVDHRARPRAVGVSAGQLSDRHPAIVDGGSDAAARLFDHLGGQ